MRLIELLADFVTVVERCHAVLGDVSMRVLIPICNGSLVADDPLLRHCVDPELARLELPLVGVVLTACDVRRTSLLLEHRVVLDT